MAWTQTDLDKLDEAIAQGITTVIYRHRTVTYRSLDEMLRIRGMMKAEIATSTGVTQVERIQRVTTDKDYQ